MKQVKLGDKLYVLDNTPYEITEDTDASMILIPEDSFNGFKELNSYLSYMTPYNYNSFKCNVPEYITEAERQEAMVSITLNAASTNYAIQFLNSYTNVKSIMIDGEEQPNVVGSYKFSSTGNHTIKCDLEDTSYIETDFMNGCWNVKGFTIGNKVEKINANAFKGCDGTQGNLVLPDGLTTIGDYAFQNCRFDGQLVIPETVTSIGEDAFSGCWNFTGALVIPSGITTIGATSFYQLKKITSVTIPDTVTTIEDNAFNGCVKVAEVNIGSGVTEIKYNAFSGCSLLESVTITATTPPTLGTSVFYNNKSGRKFYVPASYVDVYKAASGWSDYSTYIEAIPTT